VETLRYRQGTVCNAHHINNGPIPLDFGNPIAETETEGAVSDHGCEEKISKDGMAPECRS